MSETVTPPEERECELCGRRDVWDETVGNWRVVETGVQHCIHEWDINGSYNPFEG
jgi:hypothetical protein